MQRLGAFLVRRHRLVLVLTAVGVVASVPVALGIADRLTFEALTQPGAESFRGQEVIDEHFDVGVPNVTLLVSAAGGSVDDAPTRRIGRQVTRELQALPGVESVVSYFETGSAPNLRSRGGDHALVLAQVPGPDEAVDRWMGEHVEELERARAGVEVRVTGFARFFHEASEVSIEDFESAEMLTIPIVVVALLFVFGALVAAAMPLVVALVSVLATVVFLTLLTLVTDVSNFALTLVTALALGLGVDYSLFVVSRFREELERGADVEAAVIGTVETAGRTVVFSALAVLVALAGLLLVPLTSIQAMGVAAMATAGAAGVASVVILPAALTMLGPRVNKGAIWRRGVRARDGHGRWFGIAQAVMRRPIIVSTVLVGLLLVVAAPVLSINVGLTDERTFEPGNEVRAAADVLRTEFDTTAATPLFVVVPDTGGNASGLEALADEIARLEDVAAVRTPASDPALVAGETAYLVVATTAEPVSEDSDRLVSAIRALPAPYEEVLVAGTGAQVFDIIDSVTAALPRLAAFIASATFIILFLQFGSILVPLKAIALNALSILALLGALVWVFQDGHGADLLGFTASGTLYLNIPIIVFALAFGLSMDYEVFLLSRIKEEYDRSGDNDLAVATGLDRSGRIVSAAAILISVVFVSIGLAASMRLTKMFGLGLGAIVMLDAFVIRGTLVPALMKLAGAANWWAPAPLRRLQQRWGFSEHGGPGPSHAAATTVVADDGGGCNNASTDQLVGRDRGGSRGSKSLG